MLSFEEFQKRARQKFGVQRFDTPFSSPVLFLYSQGWIVPEGVAASEEELSLMNVELDGSSCFGRAVKALVLSEIFFPNQPVMAGEVAEDLLRSILLSQADEEKWRDETFLAEILQYENPHVVIVDSSGAQFDPIFSLLHDQPQTLRHPKVICHDPWEGLYCGYLVSEALLVGRQDPEKRLEILKSAEKLCPESLLVKEGLASAYGLIHDFDEVIRYAKCASAIRKDAKTLWVLWQLTEASSYRDRIVTEYHPNMLDFLTKTLMP